MYDQLLLNIVIINYKTAAMTVECLASVLADIPDRTQITVVDNQSADGSVEVIEGWVHEQREQERIKVIASSENLGFSGGNNLGIRAARAEYYLLLNSDTLVRAGALKELLAFAVAHPKAGIVSPRLEWPDGEPQISCFRNHTPVSELIASARTSFVTKLLKKYDVPLPVTDEISRPEWTSFACVLLNAKAVQQVGLMDEGYFLYFEDVDYCRAVRRFGWDVINQPRAHVVHLRGGSSPVKAISKVRKRLPRYFYASRTRYFRKHYGLVGAILTNLLWYLGRTISFIREVFERRATHLCEKQSLDIWTDMFSPLDKRRFSE